MGTFLHKMQRLLSKLKNIQHSENKLESGERGIRTLGTLLRYTRFPGVPVQPLLHLSFKYHDWHYFFRAANYEKKCNTKKNYSLISPIKLLFRCSLISSCSNPCPSKNISLVIAASVVISFPLTTPASRSSALVSYCPILTAPPWH